MNIVISIILFILGMYLCMRCIAALFSVIDLWYTINTAYFTVIRRIVGWGFITVAVYILLQHYYWQKPFRVGLITFTIFYIINHFTKALGVKRPKIVEEA